MITAEQCRAARALLDWSQNDLAGRAKIAKKTIAEFERGIRAYHPRTAIAVESALESFGVVFIPENGGGPGVRLRKAMARLFRRDAVDGRGWMAFAFDYKAKRHVGFVPYDVLAELTDDSLGPIDVFDRDKARILLVASDLADSGRVDAQGQIHMTSQDLLSVALDGDDEQRGDA